MMKQILTILAIGFVLTGCKNENQTNNDEIESGQVSEAAENVKQDRNQDFLDIDPVSHGTVILTWGDTVIHTDPTGGAEAFEEKAEPDLVFITDVHGDHMNAETLRALDLENVPVVVPNAVREELPDDLQGNFVVMENGETTELMGFTIEAIPMYNLPEGDPDTFHEKGRGNGYVIEKDGKRVYIAGDTEDIPEMRDLKDIDIAFIPMNLPYTMTVEQAAEAVLAFEPDRVYPYHFRGQDGFADVEKFKELVNRENENIEVVLLDWYPNDND